MRSADANGLRMTYERAGSGEAVVLVHGYVGDGPSTWRPQLDGLADEFDVIACDLPGAGGSDDPPESFGMRGFARALVDFLDAIELPDAHLVGLSFGGAVLIELCRRNQDRARTITLAGAYAGWAGSLPAHEVERRCDQALALSRLPAEQLVEALLPTMFAAGAPDDVTAGFAASLAAFHPAGLRAMALACTADLTDVLPTIRRPTLLIYGMDDTRAPAGVASMLHDAIHGSELVNVPKAGHVCNVDAPGSFNAALRDFLRRAPRSS